VENRNNGQVAAPIATTQEDDGITIEAVAFEGLTKNGTLPRVRVRLYYGGPSTHNNAVEMSPDDLASTRALEQATGAWVTQAAAQMLRENVQSEIPLRLYRRFTAEMLHELTFPPVSFVIPGLLPEGLGVLAGRPKIGKSWWALARAIEVAAAGGPVLYLALEDPPRRLQSRMRALLGDDKPPQFLDFRTEWSRLDQGGIEELDGWLTDKAGHARLVVIDTVAKIRPPRGASEDQYLGDYGVWGALQGLCIEHPGVAVLGVHHQRKTASEDALDTVLGSQGVTGTCDTILILKKSRGQADGELFGTGRDVEEFERALRFDGGKWSDMGDAADFRMSEERDELVTLLREEGPQTIPEIARALGKQYDAARKLCARAVEAGRVVKEGKRYSVEGE